MSEIATQKRYPWMRFTIATLLFLIFCSAGAFVGFRVGMSEGVERQVQRRLAEQQSIVYAKTYRVTKLLPGPGSEQSGSPIDQLVGDIEKAAMRSDRGETSSAIVAMPPDTIVMSGTSSEHDLAAAYLAGLRNARRGNGRLPEN